MDLFMKCHLKLHIDNALETFVIIALYKSTFTIPLHYSMYFARYQCWYFCVL